MSLTQLRSRAQRTRSDRSDDGLSLVELVVAMAIFSIVLGIYFGALISMAQTTARAQGAVDASDALRATFNAMDHQVRYATSINRPGMGASGAWYVEFEATDLPDGAPSICHQWRLDPASQEMAYRTWKQGDPTVGSWRGVSWDVVSPSAGSPFTFRPASATELRQSLTVSLRVEGRDAAVLAEQTTTFVARNSSQNSPSHLDADGDGASDTPVCLTVMGRP